MGIKKTDLLVIALIIMVFAVIFSMKYETDKFIREQKEEAEAEFEAMLTLLRKSYRVKEGILGSDSKVKLESFGEFCSYASLANNKSNQKPLLILYSKRKNDNVGGGTLWFIMDGVALYYSFP